MNNELFKLITKSLFVAFILAVRDEIHNGLDGARYVNRVFITLAILAGMGFILKITYQYFKILYYPVLYIYIKALSWVLFSKLHTSILKYYTIQYYIGKK